MPKFLHGYVRFVERINYWIGRFAMYLVFALMGVLLWSSFSKTFFTPSIWTLETAQFLMVAYYILGGPYSIQLQANVRMDLFYSNWSVRRKAWVDAFTVFFLMFYLGTLFYGGIWSAAYSLGHFGDAPFTFFWNIFTAFITGGPDAASEVMGFLERSSTAWRPYIWPVKLMLVAGVFLMLLQTTAELIKDIDRILGGEE